MKWLEEALRKQVEDEMMDILWDYNIDPNGRVSFGGRTVLEDATDRLVKKILED